MRSFKLLSARLLTVVGCALLAASAPAVTPVPTVILNDSMAASGKNAGLATDANGFLVPTGTQAVWYGGGAAPQYSAGSNIKMSAGNRGLLAYFVGSTADASQAASLQVGQSLTATITFSYTSGTGAFTTGDFRMGFLNSGGNGGPTNDGATANPRPDGEPLPDARIKNDSFSLTSGGSTPRGYSGYFVDTTAAPSPSNNSLSFWRRTGGQGKSQQWLGPTSSDVVPNSTMSQVGLTGGGAAGPVANNGTVYVATFSVTYVSAPVLNSDNSVVGPGSVRLSYTLTSGSTTVMSYSVLESSNTPMAAFDAFFIFSTYNAAIQVSQFEVDKVSIPPAITQQPTSQVVAIGGTATFTAVASGAPAPVYQWKHDGVVLTGETNATLTLTNLKTTDAGTYTVEATNAVGSVTSKAVTLTVLTKPEITSQATPVTIFEGQDATFTVGVRGAPTMVYQWKKDGVALTDGVGISGATTPSLTLSVAELSANGNYTLVITNSYGTVTSTPVVLSVVQAIPPSITSQPASQTVFEGADAQFAVVTAGAPPFTYQWMKDGVALVDDGRISGATTASLTIGAARLTDAGDYTVSVVNFANRGNPLLSAVATLGVDASPKPLAPVAIAPRDVVEVSFTAKWNRAANATGYRLDVSTDAQFGSFVTGYEDLDVGAALSASVTGLTVDTTYYYRVRAYNSSGTSESSNPVSATTLSPVPPVMTSTSSTMFIVGVPGTFTFTATGTPAPSFTATGLPSWLTLDSTTGVLSGTAPEGTAGGQFTFTVKAQNDRQPDASQSFTVQVQAAPGVEEPLTVSTLAGTAGSAGAVDASGADARFKDLTGLAVDADGNAYVADSGNHTIRKVTVDGAVTTLAGTAGTAGSADGTGAAARFDAPSGVAVDSAGTLYVADTLNHVIRKVTADGVVTTFAGHAGAAGFADGSATAARFYAPQGVALDPAGKKLYVADTNNDTIRVITLASGKVTTLAGAAGEVGSADGFGSAAHFNAPSGIAVDADGQLYVADTENGTIRSVSTDGEVVTLAGRPGSSGAADGVGSAASFGHPSALAVDGRRNIYILDTDNHTVRKLVSASGVVSTIAGHAGTSGSADGEGADARFNAPAGIAAGPDDSLYIADTNNQTLRLAIVPSLPVITTQPQNQTATVGSSATFSVEATGSPAPTYLWYHGATALTSETGSSLALSAVKPADAGDYTVVVTNALGSVTSNVASLTVNPNPEKTPDPVGINSGGGGAPSAWFAIALSLLVLLRLAFRRSRPATIPAR